MAPAQSRQLLIWSLPTLVLLFGFFWYKRKKNFFQTDPGGKDNIAVKHISDQSNFVTSASEATFENSAAYDDDDEYTVHDLKFNSTDKTVKNEVNIATSDVLVTTPKSCEFNISYINTSTPLSVDKKLITTPENLPLPIESKVIDELICFHDSLEEEVKPSDTFIIEEHIPQTLTSTIYCLNPMVQKRKQISSDNSVGIVSDNNRSDSSNCSIYEPNTLQSEDLQESDNKENNSFNSNATEVEGFKNIKALAESEESVSNQCTSTSFPKEFNDILESKMTETQISVEKNENNSGIENKLSNLDLDTAQNVEKTERDSANHSPAEVMLGSPSMCNFSDVHSEGSSDSGKGCSDVVTPPSRTPAGGSSVAGDQILSVYEFVLEQHIVGRLIGRHGVYLQDIKAKTNTNLFIKRHPETTKLKICAIEGTQQDIDAALAMIRQKFPLRRFPNLTLEKVTFVQPSSHYLLKPDIFQLQLVDGVNNDVLLSSLITAGHFFLQQPTHPSYPSLQRLNIMMNALYNSPEAPPLSEPIVDAICVAPTMGGWYRAQIMSIDELNATSDVRFLDYGGYLTVDNSSLRQIRGDFLLLPFQAIECILANVVPAGGEGAEWSEEARQVVQCLTQHQVLQAQVYEYTETGIPLVYLYSAHSSQNGLQLVLINEDLVARGYAEMVVPSSIVQ